MVEGKDWNLQHLPPHSLMASLLAQVRDLCNDQGVHMIQQGAHFLMHLELQGLVLELSGGLIMSRRL